MERLFKRLRYAFWQRLARAAARRGVYDCGGSPWQQCSVCATPNYCSRERSRA